jgi:lipopolysaccharide export system protein LptA
MPSPGPHFHAPKSVVPTGAATVVRSAAALVLALLVAELPLFPAAAQPVAAATGAGTASDNEPFQIHADSGIEWQQNARLYIARGNAVATRGTSAVHADTLIAHYRDAKAGNSPGIATAGAGATGGNTEIYRVEAEGRVTLKRDTQTVIGDRAVYDIDQAIAVITGKQLKLTTASDVVTARDSLEWYDQRQIAVARGDAVATRQGKTIKADILTAYMQKSPPPGKPGTPGSRQAAARSKPAVTPAAAGGAAPGSTPGGESKISRVDAQGHVVITNTLDTGRGDFGVYNGETGIATLIGNVVIQRGNNVIRGQRGVMDLNNNASRMLPGAAPGEARQRVQGLFIREEHRAGSAVAGPDRNPAAAGGKRP